MWVHGERVDSNQYRLQVRDRGIGLPSDFNIAAISDSLGMKPVTGLAKQLGGELTVEESQSGR